MFGTSSVAEVVLNPNVKTKKPPGVMLSTFRENTDDRQ